MDSDKDLSAFLPEPPSPRPAARDAAIEAAMRRFDAGGAASPAARPRATAPVPRRSWGGRPQIGAFATVALIAMIGVPVWMTTSQRFATDTPAPSASPVPSMVQAAAAPESAAKPPPPGTADLAIAPAATPDTAPAEARAATGSLAARPDVEPMASADAVPAPVSPPPPAPPPAALEMRQEKAELAQRGYAGPPAASAPLPPAAQMNYAAPSARAAEDRDGTDIVVTGSIVRRAPEESRAGFAGRQSREGLVANRMAPRPIRRGDWNACTLNDPSRDLAACKKLVDPAASGVRGRAAAFTADGLVRGWQGDTDGAIAAFDRALSVSPRSAIAWLNRGLAYERKGDLAQAIADLDQAVRAAPDAARGYYTRSLLYRQRGDTRRAEADEGRAIDLDRRYEAVVPGR